MVVVTKIIYKALLLNVIIVERQGTDPTGELLCPLLTSFSISQALMPKVVENGTGTAEKAYRETLE